MTDGGASDRGRQRGRGGLWLVVAVVAVAALALLPFACEDEPAPPPETPKPVAEAPKPAAPRARDGAAKPVEETPKEHDGSHVFRVVDWRGDPIAGARVWVRTPPGGVLRLPSAPPTIVAGDDGEFRLAADDRVRVVDIAAKGYMCWRLRVPAGRRDSAAPEDIGLDRAPGAISWRIEDDPDPKAGTLRVKGVLWPRGMRPPGGPPPGASVEDLEALGAIVVPAQAFHETHQIAFDGIYYDEKCIDVVSAGRLALPRSFEFDSSPELIERDELTLRRALVAQVTVVDHATGRLVERVTVDVAPGRSTNVPRPVSRWVSSPYAAAWRGSRGYFDITDDWTLARGGIREEPPSAVLPAAPVRTLAWFLGRQEKPDSQRIELRFTAPGYDPVEEKVEFAPPWSGKAIPVVEVRMRQSASAEVVPFTFVDGTGAPLAGMFVDAPFAPTGMSVEGPGRDRAPVRIRGFTDAQGMISVPVAVGTWTPWRGKDHLPTWEVSDFGVRPGQAESARAMLAEALVKVVIVDPDGVPVRYSVPRMFSHAPAEQSSRRPGQDGRWDGDSEPFVAVPGAPGTYVPLRAFHYGHRRFSFESWMAKSDQVRTVEVPFQGVATIRVTTLQ